MGNYGVEELAHMDKAKNFKTLKKHYKRVNPMFQQELLQH
jgi:hypothetical protein